MASSSGSQAGAGVTSECDGEEQDEPSSSTPEDSGVVSAVESLTLEDNTQNAEYKDELTVFREQWQKELQGNNSPVPEETKPEPLVKPPEPENEEDKAKELFGRGVELECSGKLYEAIQHYKRAMQILPDVEILLYQSTIHPADTAEASEELEVGEVCKSEGEGSGTEGEELVGGEHLLTRLTRILARRGIRCEPNHQTEEAHISWLPYEVLLLILRWVVSSELDAISLEKVGSVCRALYVASRDPDIWRSICLNTWGAEDAVCGGEGGEGGEGEYRSWRAMYVLRPRVRLHGCYISKTTYLRPGENAYQDQSYRPWYLIDYYRYLRFFPDGLVLTWSTPDEPAACVGLLRHRQFKPGLGIMAGHYRLVGDKIVIVTKRCSNEKKSSQPSNTRFRSRRKEVTHDRNEQTFHMELQIRSVHGRRNYQLAWLGYSVSSRREQRTPFELTPAKFPPYWFSRVSSYTRECSAPLPTGSST